MVSKQIQNTKSLLNDQWYELVQSIILKGSKKKIIPDVLKIKTLRRFFDSVAALMTQNLQDIVMRSLKMFTNFMCDYGVIIYYYNFVLIISVKH